MKPLMVVGAGVLVVVTLVLGWLQLRKPRAAAPPAEPRTSIAPATPARVSLFAPETLGAGLPLSVGVRTLGDTATALLPAGSTLPASVRETFSTSTDGQTFVPVRVIAGQSALASKCVAVGTFTVVEIPPMPRGMPNVVISFDVDAQGTFHLGAMDGASGHPLRVTLETPLAAPLSLDEVNRNRDSGHAERHPAEQTSAVEFEALRRKLQDLADITRHRLEARPIPDARTQTACEAALVRADRALETCLWPDGGTERPRANAQEELAAAFRELGQAAMLGGPTSRDVTSPP